jgi:UPF0755 protein
VKPFRILLVIFAALLALLGGGALYASNLVSATGVGKVTLEIKPGMNLGEVAKILKDKGLIRSAQAFRALLKISGNEVVLRDGLYDLSGKQSNLEIAKALGLKGRPREVRVTIPEGLRLVDVAARFGTTQFGSTEDFLKAFANKSIEPEIKSAPNLEGFLFPATYLFTPEDTPASITKTLVSRFNQELSSSRLEKLRALKLNVFEWVTLASVVQAEAGNDGEMPTIAGVFLNRLEIGMALQSDPIIAYGLNKRLPELSRRDGDFKIDTPYNSYKNTGLPPTPINNPGSAALEAILMSKRTNENGQKYLYFLHGRGGEFRPNTNFNAHLRDTDRFR